MMFMCKVVSCVVARGCLLSPMCSFGKTLLAFALIRFVLQGQTCLTPGISWLPTFAFQSTMMKRTSFLVLVLEDLIDLHRTIQLQLLQHYWLRHILELLWYWVDDVLFKGAPSAGKEKLLMSTICPPLLDQLTGKWGVLGKDPLLSS